MDIFGNTALLPPQKILCGLTFSGQPLLHYQSVALHQTCNLGDAVALKTQIWNWNIIWDSNVGTQASPADTCARKAKHNYGIPIGTFTFRACKSSNWHQKHLGDRGRRKGRHHNNMWPLPGSSTPLPSVRTHCSHQLCWFYSVICRSASNVKSETQYNAAAADMPLTSLTSWVTT